MNTLLESDKIIMKLLIQILFYNYTIYYILPQWKYMNQSGNISIIKKKIKHQLYDDRRT